MISSGLSFSDGDQILVSAQKPLGMVLEQDPETVVIRVVEVDPNGSVGKGGVRVGDVLVAVQNASAEDVDLEDVLAYIGNGPRVMNLRLRRAK
jgi:C-terminal processing protease CtpA/Prc